MYESANALQGHNKVHTWGLVLKALLDVFSHANLSQMCPMNSGNS